VKTHDPLIRKRVCYPLDHSAPQWLTGLLTSILKTGKGLTGGWISTGAVCPKCLLTLPVQYAYACHPLLLSIAIARGWPSTLNELNDWLIRGLSAACGAKGV